MCLYNENPDHAEQGVVSWTSLHLYVLEFFHLYSSSGIVGDSQRFFRRFFQKSCATFSKRLGLLKL